MQDEPPLLWDLNRNQAHSVPKTAFSRLRGLADKKAEAKASGRSATDREEEMSKLKASILRRIARLKPELIKELAEIHPTGAPHKRLFLTGLPRRMP